MDYSKYLNKEQTEAVTTTAPNVRVIAGAGSGKTRVLTYRISYLIEEIGIRPWKILAITFTNKVAKEMKQRILKMHPEVEKNLYIQTYHSFCARFLREEIGVLGYSRNFTIIDDEDQTKLVKDIVHDAGLKKNDPIVKDTLRYISTKKSQGKYPEDIEITFEHFPNEKDCLKFYAEYETRLRSMFSLDFDDLLLKTLIILKTYPSICAKWQSRIDALLIDEFQDTNDTEYELVKLITKPSTFLFVVGDPDQTIYTWRGANQEIILNVEKDFNMKTIVLNQNYRSTKVILDAANKLISNNLHRVPKDLFTANVEGAPIKAMSTFNDESEAQWVIGEILKLRNSNPDFKFSDVALLYRANYLTLPFERALMAKRIPYRIYGGLRFYQRAEIKDLLAYFNLLINRNDDIAFARIINVPKRGIGETSIDLMRKEAMNANKSLYHYLAEVEFGHSELRLNVIAKAKEMIHRLEDVREQLKNNDESYGSVLKTFITNIGYYGYLADDEENGEDRIDNVNSLFEDIMNFIKQNPDSGFEEYLQNVALLSAQDDMVDGDFVNLMTVHTAKGLEFKNVFIVGLSDGIFPSQRAVLENKMGMEEERRLCYVAITRAEERLYVSTNTDYSYAMQETKTQSPFIKEAGINLGGVGGFNTIKDEDGFPKASIYTMNKTQPVQPIVRGPMPTNNFEWHVGDLLTHDSFGQGKVTNVDGTLITVNFDQYGTKTLIGNHIKLHKIEKGGFDA